jgi:hypothetical protein
MAKSVATCPIYLILMNIYIFSCVSGSWTALLEFFPPFSLYRIIYEFSPPPAFDDLTDFSGVHWGDFSDRKNGMIDILLIMALEWITFLLLTFYLDEYNSLRNGIKKMALACRSCLGGSSEAAQRQTIQPQEFKASVETCRTDVFREVQTHIMDCVLLSYKKYFCLYAYQNDRIKYVMS